MIFVSRFANARTARWASTVAAPVTAVFVVAAGSLTAHCVFFAAVEIARMALIVRLVWKGRRSEVAVHGQDEMPVPFVS